ncbi:MAG: hypothetical protein AABW49_02755 [Nanoarchaeota archaeon]
MERKELYLVSGILLLFFLSFYAALVISPTRAVTTNADLYRMTGVWDSIIKPELAKGSFPLWNQYVYSGTPLIANTLTAAFHPLSAVYYIIPFSYAYIFVKIFSLLFMSVTFYMFLRAITLRRLPSLFGAIVVGFAGIITIWAGVISFMNSFMLFPLLLILSEKLITKKTINYAVCIGVILAIAILGSGPQFVLYLTMLTLFYILLRWIQTTSIRSSDVKGITLSLIIIAVITVSLAAIQLVPTIELLDYSIRDQGLSYNEATVHSLHPANLISFVIPEFYGKGDYYWGFWKSSSFFEGYIFIGVTTFLLIFFAIFTVRNKFFTTFSLMGLFSIFFALGRYNPLYYYMWKYIPFLGVIRAPGRIMLFFVFIGAAIAAMGLDSVYSVNKEKLKTYWKILAGFLFLFILILAFALLFKPIIIQTGERIVNTLFIQYSDASRFVREGIILPALLEKVPIVYNNLIKGLVIFILTISAIIVSFKMYLSEKVSLKKFVMIIILILLFELLFFSGRVISAKNFDDKFYTDELIETVKNNNGNGRVLVLRGFDSKDYLPQYIAVYHGIEKVGGCDAISIKEYYKTLCIIGDCEVKPTECIPIEVLTNPQLINKFNVDFVISNEELDIPWLDRVNLKRRDAYMYFNRKSNGAAFFATHVLRTNNQTEVLETLRDPFTSVASINLPVGRGSVDLIEKKSNKIRYNVRGEGLLVLSEVWYPGWTARLNDKPLEIHRVDNTLKGVVISENGELVLEYKPKSFRTGLYITLMAVVLVIGFFLTQFLIRLSKK